MSAHEKYMLKVTAGPTYDTKTHQDVHVNGPHPVKLSSEHLDAVVHVRIKDYRGLPPNSPTTSPYFSHHSHHYDRYSISFSFKPKRTIPGHHLVFGNDFDHPIRDRLPPLFDKAFGVVKWWIDPGLDGDVLADEPYLYGALLSSLNVLRIGKSGGDLSEGEKPAAKDDKDGEEDDKEDLVVYEEGAEDDGKDVRDKLHIPATSAQRQKFFLNEDKRKEFEFEKGRVYKCDFFNPYLDFNEFALKIGYGLPAISIVQHWDGQPLRYVLKDKSTNTELFVIALQLIPTPEAEKEGVESAEEKFEMIHKKDASKEVDGETKDDNDTDQEESKPPGGYVDDELD
jgi:hypothetical protein